MSQQNSWSPGVAGVLSFIIPGMGQIYKTQVLRGFVWLVVVGIAHYNSYTDIFVGRGGIFWPILALILAILCILDAVYKSVKTANDIDSSDERKCPYCAETIKMEAIVCRYCSRDLPPSTKYYSVCGQTFESKEGAKKYLEDNDFVVTDISGGTFSVGDQVFFSKSEAEKYIDQKYRIEEIFK